MTRICQKMLLFIGLVGSFCVVAADDADKLWQSSPHADSSSSSFTHWDDEGIIPGNCASCHSGTGFLDYLGADGSSPFEMDKEHATGSLVDCQSCHNPTTKELDSVTFPSGVVVSDIGSSATCMVCHQGRSSTGTVLEKVGDTPADTINNELAFINIHYRAAAATLLGSQVQGGFEYPDKSYAGRFAHVPGFTDCADCHNPHSLSVTESSCSQCHQDGAVVDIRMSNLDLDDDGDVTEGVASEISAIHDQLKKVIVDYASSIAKQPIIYDAHAYPYFFNDANDNGSVDPEEASYPNRYQSWTPRLLKAAYNYQFVAKDPGAYAHNPDYVTQILIDSIDDLGKVLELPGNGFLRPE